MNPKTIIVTRLHPEKKQDWFVSLLDQEEKVWARGPTVYEALGRLLWPHRELFGVRFAPPKRPNVDLRLPAFEKPKRPTFKKPKASVRHTFVLIVHWHTAPTKVEKGLLNAFGERTGNQKEPLVKKGENIIRVLRNVARVTVEEVRP